MVDGLGSHEIDARYDMREWIVGRGAGGHGEKREGGRQTERDTTTKIEQSRGELKGLAFILKVS